MFQYAIGRALAKKKQTECKMDTSGYKNQKGITPRKYALQVFNTKETFASEDEIVFFAKFFSSYKIGKILLKLYNFLPVTSRYYVHEPHFHFFEQIFDVPETCYVEGYWQSEKYFKNIEKVIRQEFTLKDHLREKLDQKILNLISGTNSVSIHVRRGDYVTNKAASQTHSTCSIDYYERAIRRIAKDVKDIQLFVFSDDIQWVKDNLHTNHPITHVSNGNYTDYEELILMSHCKHNIIANSSFSWWGAWLNNNEEKIVIAPNHWFVDTSYDSKDLILDSWIKM